MMAMEDALRMRARLGLVVLFAGADGDDSLPMPPFLETSIDDEDDDDDDDIGWQQRVKVTNAGPM